MKWNTLSMKINILLSLSLTQINKMRIKSLIINPILIVSFKMNINTWEISIKIRKNCLCIQVFITSKMNRNNPIKLISNIQLFKKKILKKIYLMSIHPPSLLRILLNKHHKLFRKKMNLIHKIIIQL